MIPCSFGVLVRASSRVRGLVLHACSDLPVTFDTPEEAEEFIADVLAPAVALPGVAFEVVPVFPTGEVSDVID